jgi:hypothetical protein
MLSAKYVKGRWTDLDTTDISRNRLDGGDPLFTAMHYTLCPYAIMKSPGTRISIEQSAIPADGLEQFMRLWS